MDHNGSGRVVVADPEQLGRNPFRQDSFKRDETESANLNCPRTIGVGDRIHDSSNVCDSAQGAPGEAELAASRPESQSVGKARRVAAGNSGDVVPVRRDVAQNARPPCCLVNDQTVLLTLGGNRTSAAILQWMVMLQFGVAASPSPSTCHQG
jgi:hypothetical protein